MSQRSIRCLTTSPNAAARVAANRKSQVRTVRRGAFNRGGLGNVRNTLATHLPLSARGSAEDGVLSRAPPSRSASLKTAAGLGLADGASDRAPSSGAADEKKTPGGGKTPGAFDATPTSSARGVRLFASSGGRPRPGGGSPGGGGEVGGGDPAARAAEAVRRIAVDGADDLDDRPILGTSPRFAPRETRGEFADPTGLGLGGADGPLLRQIYGALDGE